MLLHLAGAGLMAGLLGRARAAEYARFEPWSGPAPQPIALDDLDRRPVALADFRGRPVILHFFATWCEPCRRELPGLAALCARHAASGLAALALSVAEPDIRVRRFFERSPAPFPVLLDRNRAAAKAWGADVLPTSILLDRTLTPRQLAQGEIDWTGAEAGQAVAALAGAPATPQDEASNQGGKG